MRSSEVRIAERMPPVPALIATAGADTTCDAWATGG